MEEPASLSEQLKELEDQLIRESGERELLRETPKRKRKVQGGPKKAAAAGLPLPAVAPPTVYLAPRTRTVCFNSRLVMRVIGYESNRV